MLGFDISITGIGSLFGINTDKRFRDPSLCKNLHHHKVKSKFEKRKIALLYGK